MKRLLVAALVALAAHAAYGQSFTCSYGSEPACLEFGAKVCSRQGKCVQEDAICFDHYTCDFEGFVCKSKFDTAINEYERLRRDHNSLVETASRAATTGTALNLALEATKTELMTLRECLQKSSTIDAAKACN